MQAGIIGGTGLEGRGVAARLAASGVPVLLGSRTLERAREAVDRIREAGGALPVEAATNETIVERATAIVLAVPLAAAAEVVSMYGERLAPGTLVVDVTVPLAFVDGAPALLDVPEGSAAAHLRARLPDGVRLAATLKTIPASLLGRLDAPLECDEFVCADSPEARDAAMELFGRIEGLRLIDAGGLESARTLEHLSALAIRINKRYRVRTARFRVMGV